MSNAESTGPFRRRGFVIAAIAVGAIVLLGIIAIVASLLTSGDDAPPTPAPTTSSTADPTTEADASVCGLPGFEDASSLDGPPPTEWKLVGTVAAPTSPTGPGPGEEEDGFRTCYAHTAEGALYAAVNYIALASDTRNVPRLPELIEPGPGRDAALAQASSSTPSSTRLQVAGFKVNSYSAEEAVIDVAWTVTSESGALVSFPTVLHWVDGDWKIVVDDSGQPPFGASPLKNLGGYTPWAGV